MTFDLLEHTLTRFQEGPRSVRVAPGYRFRSVNVPHGRAQLVVDFPTQVPAGGSITYGESESALDALYNGVVQRPQLQNHPIQVRISRSGNQDVAMRVTISWDQGELFPIHPPGIRLLLEGVAHPERPLRGSDARKVIDSLATRYQNDYTQLLPGQYSAKRGRISLSLDFEQYDPGVAWPVLTMNQITFILHSLEAAFEQRGAWFEVFGMLAFEPPNAEEYNIGNFYFEHIGPLTDETPVITSNNNQTNAVQVS